MKKHKGIIIACAAAVAAIAVCVGMTFSYLVSVPNGVENEITVGYDRIEIVEQFTPPTKQEPNKDSSYKKRVTVKNNGDTPCFVRVYADFSSAEIRSISSFSFDEEGSNYYSAEREMTSDNFVYEVTEADNNWVFVPDSDAELGSELGGYYYYTKPLKAGEETPPLFTYVKTDNTNHDVQQYDVIVYAESVQTVTQDGQSEHDYKYVWQEFLKNSNI